MSVKAKLEEIRSRRPTPIHLPEQPKIWLAARILQPEGVGGNAKPPPDRDLISERLHFAFRSGQAPELHDIRQAGWCLWEGKHPLADDPRVLESYLAYVENSGKTRLFRQLVAAYLITFPRDAPTLGRVAQWLESMAGKVGDPWDRVAKALDLFDPERGPKRVAEVALAAGSTASRVLEEHGVAGLAAESGFGETSFLAGLAALRDRSPSDHRAHLEQVKAWVLRPDNSLIFDQHRGPLIEAAVLPFADASLPKDGRDRILSFLLSRFGDPRLESAQWPERKISPAVDIVHRWLTDQSLRQFLDVVDRSAAMEHQWIYRRAFWEAVYRHDLISEAWVIFDPIGVANARAVFGTDTPYAQWRDQVSPGHSCLLLKIGRGVVAEWSHNGRCHIWPDRNDPTAPDLYQSHYRKDEARRFTVHQDRMSITHISSDTYNWQKKIAKEIQAMTNVLVKKHEYTVEK